ncbi:MAG: C39 family peptidase, partial [Solobacterium sp.]|nr:C39 family peptidase [Solobacterium sp.]
EEEEPAAAEEPVVEAQDTGSDAAAAGVDELAAEAENKTAFVRHRIELTQSVQEKTHYGGAAVVQMILRSHGIEKTQADLAAELNTSTVTGTEYADAARVLNTYLFSCEVPGPADPGYRVEYLTPGSVGSSVMDKLRDRVVRDVRTLDPIIIAINTNVLYPDLPKANHFVLITGYRTVDDVITEYYIVDPSPDVQNSEYAGLKVFTIEEIRRAFDTNSEPAYIW